MNTMIEFAPLQGYTDPIYIYLHHKLYGGVARYTTPFMRVEKGRTRRQDLNRLTSPLLDGIPVTAQVICRDAQEFRTLVEDIGATPVRRVDINMGCPFPMQTRLGRGAAMLSHPQVFGQIAEAMRDYPEFSFSVKMRLGMGDATEWKECVPALRAMQLTHVCIHPRTAQQMYGGRLHLEQFREFAAVCGHTVIYNGDVLTPQEAERAARLTPQVRGVMIGRGLLARPSLGAEVAEGEDRSPERRLADMLYFHDEMLRLYSETLCGDTQILSKIRTFWDYSQPQLDKKVWKALHKARSLASWREAVSRIIL